MKQISFLFLLIISINSVYARKIKYPADKIPENLIENAYAVIRNVSEDFNITSISRASKTVKYAITVLNKSGDNYSIFCVNYDKFVGISNIHIRIYNKNGNVLKKVKGSDIEDYSNISGYSLFEDNRCKYYKPNISSYPYTVEVEYNLNYHGLFNYPSWYPVSKYNLSVEKASFSVTTPLEFSFKYKECNLPKGCEIVKEKSEKKYIWRISEFPAVEKKDFSPDFTEFMPVVLIAPNIFELDGIKGNMITWEEFGKWEKKLLKGRDSLSNATITKIRNLVKGEKSKVDSIKKIYQYMQSKTRYVSVQEGIGSWQPIQAYLVDKLGYGDCKALTNYTLALLKSVGIKSYYTKVMAGNNTQKMIKDFVCNQANHAILCVPVKEDTIWLECTNQNQPFGFLGSATDDRDVFIITDNGGEIAHTTVYKQSDNIQIRRAEVIIDNLGSAIANIKTKYNGLQYENVEYPLNQPYINQKKWLLKNIDIENFKIDSFCFNQVKKRIPYAELYLKLKINDYVSDIGTRIFLPLNLMNKSKFVPKKERNRKIDIYLSYAYSDIDSINYVIPDNYSIEAVPKDTTINTIFGGYSSTIKINGNKILFVRKIIRNKGTYPPDKYGVLLKFYKDICVFDSQYIVLKD